MTINTEKAYKYMHNRVKKTEVLSIDEASCSEFSTGENKAWWKSMMAICRIVFVARRKSSLRVTGIGV